MTDPHLIARRDALDKVDVHTYPYVLEALRVFEKYGLKQGGGHIEWVSVCGPASRCVWNRPHFATVVTADCVPEGCHKPSPHPWHLLRARLAGMEYSGEVAEPISDMMFIESSSGGGFSEIRAGSGPTISIADTIPATIAKMKEKEKMKRFQAEFSDMRLPGRATFIPDFGALVSQSRQRTDRE